MKAIGSRQAAAFSLVEVTAALGIAGFCLLAIFGLLPVGLRSNQTSTEQTNANALLSAIVSDLRATPPTVPPGSTATSNQYSIAIPASGSTSTLPDIYFDNDRQMVAAAAARYRVAVSFLSSPSGGGAKSATMALIKVSWPAAASAANATGSVQVFTALDRN